MKLCACTCLAKGFPFGQNCSLQPVCISCSFCVVTFGGFLSSVSAAPPGSGPSRRLPFSLSPCSCHPQWPSWLPVLLQRWLFCSPAGIPWVCRPFQLERPGSLSLTSILVSGVFGPGCHTVLFFFFLLVCTSLFGGRTSGDSCRKGAILSSWTCQLRVGNRSQVIYSLLFPEREICLRAV